MRTPYRAGMDAALSPSCAPPLISVRRLALTLPGPAGPVNILRDISFDVAAADSVAVVGPSGSGKTSLVMVLAGLERPSGGDVRIAGIDLASLDEDDLARFRGRHIGIVFQAFHLVPGMTALENVMVPLELAGRRDAEARARAMLAAVGLSHRLAHYPRSLSGGEQQRVTIARALGPEPSLLLADEPTGNLDRATGTGVMDLLFHMQRDAGATLLLITHDLALAKRCARVLQLADGKLAVPAPA
ncbi:MAG: ABC transporter ATP-binding protein [Acetobacteraceae bacterium]